jgi:hypothetical protein
MDGSRAQDPTRRCWPSSALLPSTPRCSSQQPCWRRSVASVVAWWRPRLPRLARYWFYPFYPIHFAVIRWIGSQKFAFNPSKLMRP